MIILLLIYFWLRARVILLRVAKRPLRASWLVIEPDLWGMEDIAWTVSLPT